MGTKGNGRPPVDGGGGDGQGGGSGPGGHGPYEVMARKAQFELAQRTVLGREGAERERERDLAFVRLKIFEAEHNEFPPHNRANIVDLRTTDGTGSGVVFLQTEQLAHILKQRENESHPRGELLMNRLGINSSARNVDPETGIKTAAPEAKLASMLIDLAQSGERSNSDPYKRIVETASGRVNILLSRKGNGYIVTAFNSRE